MEGDTFNLKEARHHLKQRDLAEKVHWHNNVWDVIYWPKVKTFLWLLMHKKILTWENL